MANNIIFMCLIYYQTLKKQMKINNNLKYNILKILENKEIISLRGIL